MGGDSDMVRKHQIAEYHKMVWRSALSDILAYYRADIRNWLGEIVVALLSGIGYSVYSYLRSETMIDWLGIFIFFIFGFIGYAVLSFLYRLIWVSPAQTYGKKEAEANLLTWKDVDIKPFDFPQTSGFGVGLEMISHKPKYESSGLIIEHLINEVIPKATIISRTGETEAVQYNLPLLVGSTTFERQDIVRSREQLKNDGHLTTAISIANWDENRAWVTIWKKDENIYGKI
jgi:hypothetical protein